MFLGQQRLILDDKNRLTLPSKYRRELEQGVVLAPGPEYCVRLFPQPYFEQQANQMEQALSDSQASRNFTRLVFSRASSLTPDKQGRIIIPPELRAYAKLDSDVVVAGVNRHIEIWNAQAWDRLQDDLGENSADIFERVRLGKV